MELKVKQFVTLKQQREHKVKELWCEEQQDDVQHIIDLMEDVALAALNTSSAQGYTTLQYAKDNFVSSLLGLSEKYRVINSTHQSKKHTDAHTL